MNKEINTAEVELRELVKKYARLQKVNKIRAAAEAGYKEAILNHPQFIALAEKITESSKKLCLKDYEILETVSCRMKVTAKGVKYFDSRPILQGFIQKELPVKNVLFAEKNGLISAEIREKILEEGTKSVTLKVKKV